MDNLQSNARLSIRLATRTYKLKLAEMLKKGNAFQIKGRELLPEHLFKYARRLKAAEIS